VDGIYADSRDVEVVTAAIQHLYSDEAYYRKMALSAWCRAQHFSQSAFRRKIKSTFNVNEEIFAGAPLLEV